VHAELLLAPDQLEEQLDLLVVRDTIERVIRYGRTAPPAAGRQKGEQRMDCERTGYDPDDEDDDYGYGDDSSDDDDFDDDDDDIDEEE
jgi:hypothetical protein